MSAVDHTPLTGSQLVLPPEVREIIERGPPGVSAKLVLLCDLVAQTAKTNDTLQAQLERQQVLIGAYEETFGILNEAFTAASQRFRHMSAKVTQ